MREGVRHEAGEVGSDQLADARDIIRVDLNVLSPVIARTGQWIARRSASGSKAMYSRNHRAGRLDLTDSKDVIASDASSRCRILLLPAHEAPGEEP